MIREQWERIMRLLFPKRAANDRIARAYLVHQGSAVVVNDLEKTWLEDDYETLFHKVPVFRTHPHPALRNGLEMVSIELELNP